MLVQCSRQRSYSVRLRYLIIHRRHYVLDPSHVLAVGACFCFALFCSRARKLAQKPLAFHVPCTNFVASCNGHCIHQSPVHLLYSESVRKMVRRGAGLCIDRCLIVLPNYLKKFEVEPRSRRKVGIVVWTSSVPYWCIVLELWHIPFPLRGM